MDSKLSRRDVLQRSAALGVLAVVGVEGCKEQPKALSCTDTMSLSAADMQVRTSLGYSDKSPQPGKSCSLCQQFLPGPPNACGNCKVVKGPINPGGYCKSFVAKTT